MRESTIDAISWHWARARWWIVIARFASPLSACDLPDVCVHACVLYFFFLLSLLLTLALAPPLNLEYDRPIVRAIGTNSPAIKLLDGRSRAGCKSRERTRTIVAIGESSDASLPSYKSLPRTQIIFNQSNLGSVYSPAITIVLCRFNWPAPRNLVSELPRDSPHVSPRGHHVQAPQLLRRGLHGRIARERHSREEDASGGWNLSRPAVSVTRE